MKYILTGRHSSGVYSVLNQLEEMGVVVGREFFTINDTQHIYSDKKHKVYHYEDVKNIFETQTYLYMCSDIEQANLFRGFSLFEYDKSDALVIPSQFISAINNNVLEKNDIVVIWLDTNLNKRISNFVDCGDQYDFYKMENTEKEYDDSLIDFVHSHQNLYFYNEDPDRVAAIIYSLIKHPDLLEIYLQKYN